ncbi:DMT family transporter [Herbaspirillum lusitanum]|uniref:DMT family transporter n=1 Tax=Herbaspirillum lusitanum TaxID=213312 RepID=A0ABW9ACG4_9BURK
MQHLPKPAVGALLLNTTIWGLSWTAFKSLQAMGIHPLWSTAAIFICCSLWLLLIKRNVLREMRGHPELLYVALAAGAANSCFNGAIAFGDVVRVILLFYLMPIWTVILARLMLHEPVTPRALARIAVCLCGAMIVLYRPELGVPLPHSISDWAAVLGGLALAVNNVLLRRLHGVSDSVRAIAMLGGGATLATLLGVLCAGFGMIDWPLQVPSAAWPILGLWSVLFLISNLAMQYGVSRLPANITAVLMLIEILIATFSAWLLGAAELRPQDLIGGVLIIATPWLIRDKRPQAATA